MKDFRRCGLTESPGRGSSRARSPRRTGALLRHKGLFPKRPLCRRQRAHQGREDHARGVAARYGQQRTSRRLASVPDRRFPARHPRAGTQGVRGCGDGAQHHRARHLRASERAEGRRNAEGAFLLPVIRREATGDATDPVITPMACGYGQCLGGGGTPLGGCMPPCEEICWMIPAAEMMAAARPKVPCSSSVDTQAEKADSATSSFGSVMK